MKTMKTALLISMLAATSISVSADTAKVTLTRQEATNLFTALSSIQEGPTPVDLMAVADDINALDATAKTLQKGQQAAARLQYLVPEGPEKTAKMLAINAPIEAKGDESVTLDLTPIDLNADEVKALTVAPNGPTRATVLGLIRRFLSPPPAKK